MPPQNSIIQCLRSCVNYWAENAAKQKRKAHKNAPCLLVWAFFFFRAMPSKAAQARWANNFESDYRLLYGIQLN
jgi:hypothetical protein